eukprot:c27374_g1_i1 orf=3-245(-)
MTCFKSGCLHINGHLPVWWEGWAGRVYTQPPHPPGFQNKSLKTDRYCIQLSLSYWLCVSIAVSKARTLGQAISFWAASVGC